MQKKLKTEIRNHKIVYILFALIVFGATYVRVYRTNIILQFFYDQGRDGIQIWNLIHKGDFFLIGPTTGIAGIFRGPLYYYLISPFYWLGGGNPVFPAVFLALLSVAAFVLAFYIGKLFNDYITGIIIAFLSSFSFYMMKASRWLSNPTPMLFLSMVFVLSFYLIMKKKEWGWILLSLTAGISLFHFGSSGEFFYFPAILVFIIWQKDKFPSVKTVFLSAFVFLLTASPLVLFDLRNNFLLTNNIKAFLFERGSFRSGFIEVLNQRLDFYNGVFWGNIFPSMNLYSRYFVYAFFFLFLYSLPDLLKNKYFKLTALLLLSPMIGLLFFQGNEGNIYGYYLTGYYLIFMLFLGIVLREIFNIFFGKIFVIAFLLLFLNQNAPIIKSYINDGVDGPTTIALRPQLEAIEWVYTDATGQDFNIDVYVPPVIPYAYDYLFMWYPTTPRLRVTGSTLVNQQVSLLYTIYEEDPPHPERLEAWMNRQAGIGEVVYSQKFAGITVQRRKRL